MPKRKFTPRTVGDIMSSPAITVEDTDSYKLVVSVLRANRVSAVPVVGQEGELLGIVSEADLMLKEEGEVPGSVLHPVQRHRQQAKANNSYAGGLMSSPVLTVRPDASVPQAARTMQKAGVKRLVVVDNANRPLGIVSRGDILKVFLRDDAELVDEIIEGVIGQDMMIDTGGINVSARDGIVTLTGQVEYKADIGRLYRLVSAVEGVVAANVALDYRADDTIAGFVGPVGPVAGLR